MPALAPSLPGQVLAALGINPGERGKLRPTLIDAAFAVFDVGQLAAAYLHGASIGPIAAQNSHLQLFAQTRPLAIRRWYVHSSAADSIITQFYATALTTNLNGPFLRAAANTKADPTIAGSIRTQTNAGVLGTNMITFDVAAGVWTELPFLRDLIVPAANGVQVVQATVNLTMKCVVEWDSL